MTQRLRPVEGMARGGRERLRNGTHLLERTAAGAGENCCEFLQTQSPPHRGGNAPRRGLVNLTLQVSARTGSPVAQAHWHCEHAPT